MPSRTADQLPPLQGHSQIGWAELFGYCEPMLLPTGTCSAWPPAWSCGCPSSAIDWWRWPCALPQRFQGPAKGLLREACLDLFPADYLNRPKQGFALPMRPWMLGPLLDLCLARLERLQAIGWLDPSWIRSQW